MTQIVDAVFENGLLRPLEPLSLSDGQHVKLTVETDNSAKTAHVIELAQKVYEGLTSEEIDEIEKAIQRRPFFSRPIE